MPLSIWANSVCVMGICEPRLPTTSERSTVGTAVKKAGKYKNAECSS